MGDKIQCDVNDGMRDAICECFLNEYSGRSPKDVQRSLNEAKNGQHIENLPGVRQNDIDFPSVSAVGKYGALYEPVRVQTKMDGGPPPEGPAVRYSRVEHVAADKWLAVGQSDSYNYYSELLPF